MAPLDFPGIENLLIAATPEVELQTPLRQYEGAVDEHIQLRKQISLRLGAARQLLKGVAGIGLATS